jgi:hypothetical protein
MKYDVSYNPPIPHPLPNNAPPISFFNCIYSSFDDLKRKLSS